PTPKKFSDGVEAKRSIVGLTQALVEARRPGKEIIAEDGITEDLTTELSRIPEMFVISRRTAFTYRNTPIHTKQIGRQLGVRYVLEGTVRRSGNRVRITTQLVDAESDLPLWVERYDRNVTEFLDLQSEIATAILGAIEPELLKFERERIARRPQQN